MYAAELVPVDLLVFVAVLVDDFFAIKLFHYHVPVQCGCETRQADTHEIWLYQAHNCSFNECGI